MTKHKKYYQVLSPDGFSITCEPSYPSLKQAKQALAHFIERYTAQGYYSQTCYNGYNRRISLAELPDYCTIINLNDN